MKFNFPKQTELYEVTLRFGAEIAEKVQKIAQVHGCSVIDVYSVIILEAIDDYEQEFGKIELDQVQQESRDVSSDGPDGKEYEKIARVMTHGNKTRVCQKCGSTQTIMELTDVEGNVDYFCNKCFLGKPKKSEFNPFLGKKIKRKRDRMCEVCGAGPFTGQGYARHMTTHK